MNRWGALARRHWSEHRPSQYAQIPDPEVFFAAMGERIGAEVHSLARSLAGEDRPGEGYLAKVRRLNTAMVLAREQVLREVLPPSETDDIDDEDVACDGGDSDGDQPRT